MDRAVLISLARRNDRRAAFFSQPQLANWPLPKIEVFAAVDGWAKPLPSGWLSGSGSRGCQQSHVAVLKAAVDDKVGSLLVLEDDAQLCDRFAERFAQFMATAPDDWDCLMLGGQHRGGTPTAVSPGVVRCHNTQRTHAYLIRGKCLEYLHGLWAGMTTGHIDHLAKQWQPNWKVYSPSPFLIGQAAGQSDITCRMERLRFWSHRPGTPAPIGLPGKHRHFTRNHAQKATAAPTTAR